MTVAPATFSSGTTASHGRKTWRRQWTRFQNEMLVYLEIETNHALPESTSNCAEEAHAQQEDDNSQDDEI